MEMNWVVRGKAALNAGQNFAGGASALVDVSTIPDWLKPALKSGGRGLYLSDTLRFDHPEVGKFKLELEYAYEDWARTLDQVQFAYTRAIELRLKRQQANDELIRGLLMDESKRIECWVDATIEDAGNGAYAYTLKDDGIFAPGHGKLLTETYASCPDWSELLEHARAAGVLRAEQCIRQMQEVYAKDMAARAEKEKAEEAKKQAKHGLMLTVAKQLIGGNAPERLNEGYLGLDEVREVFWKACCSDLRDVIDSDGLLDLEIIQGEAGRCEAKTLSSEQFTMLRAVRGALSDLTGHNTGLPDTVLSQNAQIVAITPGYLDDDNDKFGVTVVLRCPAFECNMNFLLVQKGA